MTFFLYFFFFIKSFLLQEKFVNLDGFINYNNCSWDHVTSDFDVDTEIESRKMFEVAKLVACSINIADKERYESFVECKGKVYYPSLEYPIYEQNTTYRIESCREKCAPMIELTGAHIELDMRAFNVGEEGTYNCLYSDKKVTFICGVGGLYLFGVKADIDIVNYVCRSNCTTNSFHKLFQNSLIDTYKLLSPFKSFPNNKIMCGNFQTNQKDKIECSNDKYSKKSGALAESETKTYTYCKSYCKLPKIDIAGIKMPKTKYDYILDREIIFIGCGFVSMHIRCFDSKFYILYTQVPFDINILAYVCDKGNTMDFLRNLSGKDLKPEHLNLLGKDGSSINSLTDVRCKLVRQNKILYSQLRYVFDKLYAKDENNNMIDIMQFDEISQCTSICTIENAGVSRENNQLTDILSVQCSGQQKKFYCVGNLLCEHEQEEIKDCFGMAEACGRMGIS